MHKQMKNFTTSSREFIRKDVLVLKFGKLFDLSAADLLFGVIGSSVFIIGLYMFTSF